MPRELTRDEFIQVFGSTPEEYEAKNPSLVTQPAKPQRLEDIPGVRDAVRTAVQRSRGTLPEQQTDEAKTPAFKTRARRFAEEHGHKMNAFEEALDYVASPLEQGQANIMAGILSIPSSVGGAVDLVRKGVPAVYEAATTDKDIADTFMSRIMTPESIAKLEQVQISAIDKFRQQNPKATEQQVTDFAKRYVNSDEFYNATINELPGGFQMATKGQDWANDVAGLGRRSDQMTAGDEATQIAGSAFVGLPAGAVSKITRPVVRALGEKVANNVATKLAARAIEAVTPMTLPLTPGNVAVNAGVGVGINEAIRGVQGQDTLVDYSQIYDPDKAPAPENVAAASGLAAAAIFGLPGLSRVVKNQATQATQQVIKKIGQEAGPTLEEQSGKLTPQLNPARGLFDQNAPVKAAIRKSGGSAESQQLADATMSAASTVNRVEAENNALNYGILEGIGRNTVPFTEIKGIYDRFDAPTKDVFDKYVYAVQRKQDSAIYQQSLDKQMRQARADVQTANLSGNDGRKKAAQKALNELTQKYNSFLQDAPDSRSSMVNWSRGDVDNFIKAGENNPAIKKVADAMKRVSADLVDYLYKNGVIDAEEAMRRVNSRELYVPLQERRHAGATGIKRRALLFADKFKSADNDVGFFINTAPRDISGEGAKVNNPKTAIVAMQEGVMDAVRSVAANNARRDIVDRLWSLPDAQNKFLKPYEFNLGNGRKSTSISPSQYQTIYPRGIKNEGDYIKVFRNGKVELWEFSDPSITKSLQFAPLAAVPVMNATRKIWQQMTTGLAAPWFAGRTFAWDVPMGQTTKNAGRSLGLADTLARRLAMGSSLERPVNAFLDAYGIAPGAQMVDAGVAAAAAIPYQMGLRAMRAVGDKVATDLATHSGLFNAISQSGPRGQQLVRGVGAMMASAFDSSALGVMSRNMSTSLSHLNDVSKIADDYANAALKHTGPVKAAFGVYKAMLESVHMATKTAFFANNYGILKAKYGDNIPAKELKKLVQETRNLTGDMSRQSNSAAVQKVTSVIPYSNAMIQGTRHLLSSAVPQFAKKGVNSVGGNMLTDRNTRFWNQFTSGVMLPALGSAAVLSNWDGAEEYWYNQTPKWKQATTIPIPSVEALEYLAENGSLPPFDPKYVNEVPLSPEFAIIMEPVKAGLRAMGMMGSGPNKLPGSFSQDVKNVMDQITSFSTPPVISALFAAGGQRFDLHKAVTMQGATSPIRPIPGGGANADMMTTNSDIPQAVYDTIGALAGSAAQIAMQTWNVFDISKDEGNSFGEALDDAWDTGRFEVLRRFPAVSVPTLYNARERLYSSTPESEYVYKTEDALEPITGSGRQMSVETDRDGNADRQAALGLIPAQKIRDPNLKSLASVVYDQLMKKGAYKDAAKASSSIRKDLAALEASRYKAKDDDYNRVRNNMVRKLQEQTRIQSQELQTLERQLQKSLGRRFIQQYGVPFSYKALSDLVRKDVAQ